MAEILVVIKKGNASVKYKVVSLNLWLGGILFDDALDFLRSEDADIVLLQEVYDGTSTQLDRQYRSIEVLRQELGYVYDDFVADFLDHDRTGGLARRGNAILSKHPLIPHAPVFFDMQYSETYRDVPGQYHLCPRDLQHVSVQLPGDTALDVFNIQGVWDLDGDNYSDQRRSMARTVVNEVRGLPCVVLAGDTNAKPTNQAILDIEQHLRSVFAKDELKSTFNMRRKDNPGYATAAVDMILVSPNIDVVSKKCPNIDISDHLPLVAEFEIPTLTK